MVKFNPSIIIIPGGQNEVEFMTETLNFEYVVCKKAPPKLCFGSTLERETLPTSGPCQSPFMRRINGMKFPNVGPGSHERRGAFYDLQHRHTSIYGVGPRAARFPKKHVHIAPLIAPKEKPVKPCCAPFNSTSKRKGLFQPNTNPAPCDYLGDFKHKNVKFSYCFNSGKSLKCAVQIKCVPYNLDQCAYCGCSCSAQGDYWSFENRLFLCRKDYDMLFTHCLDKFQGAKLAQFKSVRDCFFAHEHNSCKAAMKIMTHENIVKKLRKEAYLDLYFPQRRFCD